jgi:hypothetical protein
MSKKENPEIKYDKPLQSSNIHKNINDRPHRYIPVINKI